MKTKSISLINPPSPFLINQKAVPPLGLLYLAGYLREKGHEVSLLDLAGREASDAVKIWVEADLYGITAATSQYPLAVKIKDVLRARFQNARVAVGGPHASCRPAECETDGFDLVIWGEGEEILDLAMRNRQTRGTVHGVQVHDLDSLPMPAWDLIDIRSYGYSFGYGPAASVITSRGCSWGRCAFCSSIFRGARYHSSERVLQEIEHLYSLGFQSFQFLDDAFTGNTDRLERILEKLALISAKWRCYSRAGVSMPILRKMYAAGCREIGFGAESGCQEVLDRVSKGTRVEDNTNFVRDCKDVGITVQAFILLGLPGETRETIQRTQGWFLDARPDKFGLNLLMPFPGTPIFQSPEKFGIRVRGISFDQMVVKGRDPKDIVSPVATKALGFEELEEAYRETFDLFSKVTGFVPGVSNG